MYILNLQRGLGRRRRSVLVALLAAAVGLFPATPVAAANGELTELAPNCKGGSSDPTFYSNNRRLALTAGHRTLAVFDPHGSGVQLKWRDAAPGSEWKKETQGAVSDGQLLGTDTTNDRPASIVVDKTGETAWVVWAGHTFSMVSDVRMRRLTAIDAPGGPTVGPEIVLRPGGLGNVRVDAEYHQGDVFVTWTEKTPGAIYKLMAGRLSSPVTDTPFLTDVGTLWSGSASSATGTLVPTSEGLRVAARTQRLRIYLHNSGSSWTAGPAGVTLSGKARPAAIALESGSILVAAQSDFSTSPISKVFRFNNNGTSPQTELTASGGYAQPTLVHTGGDNALVVMVKSADTLVSRGRTAGSWASGDTIELTASDAGNYAWPNALREPTDGQLRLLVDGKRCPTSAQQQQVLHYMRPLAP